MEEGRSTFKILTAEPIGQRLLVGLGLHGRTILQYLKEIGVSTRNRVDSVMDWNYWRAFLNAALDFLVPKLWS